MHDLRTNNTFAARNPHQTSVISNVDALLKKVSQEYSRPSESPWKPVLSLTVM